MASISACSAKPQSPSEQSNKASPGWSANSVIVSFTSERCPTACVRTLASGCSRALCRRQHTPLGNQTLYQRIVAREQFEAVVTSEVGAAVAGMRDGGSVSVHHGENNRGAHIPLVTVAGFR